MSMICAPPMIVFNSDPCPGQSTNVNWRYCYFTFSNFYGNFVRNAEKPKSRVIPRYWDWGFLSKEAVDVTSLKIRHNEVFPESTWPRTPIFMFMHLEGSMFVCYYLDT